MKLRALEVRGFKSLAEFRISFEDTLTVVVGENDAGKTSLIECLKVITQGRPIVSDDFTHGHDAITKSIAYKQNDVAKWLIDAVPGVRESLCDLRPWIDDTTLPSEVNTKDLESRKISLRSIAIIVNNADALEFLPADD